MKNLNKVILFITFIMLVTVSCKDDKKTETATENEVKKEVVDEPKIEEPVVSESSDGTLEIAGDDAMKFDKSELKAKAGQKITLTLTHTGKMAKNVMGHNWVLLKQGADITAFAEKAIAAGPDKEYIPEENVIVSTKIIGGGESVTITFDAPAAGTYDFICSFPGHYGMMKGKFIVE